MEYRNPVYGPTAQEIDCEINHPEFGWMPYAVRGDSAEALQAELWTAFQSDTVAAYTPPAATVERVKAEAMRRILAIVPEWKQRNLTAQAAILSEKGRANWTAEELAAWDGGSAIWAQVAAIRAASDRIEAMDPIPHDFRDDRYWDDDSDNDTLTVDLDFGV